MVVLCTAICASAFRTVPARFRNTATRAFLFGKSDKGDAAPKSGGGMFGGMGNMMENMKKAQEMMKHAEQLKNQMSQEVFTGKDPSGLATATFDGMGKPLGVKVSDELVAKGAESISRATTQAVLDAHTKATEAMQKRLQGAFPGM